MGFPLSSLGGPNLFGWLKRGNKLPEDENSQRRNIVKGMFYWLLAGVILSSSGLVLTAGMFMGIFLGNGGDSTSSMNTTDQFLQGVVLTSITGTIAALLAYMSMIVKGIVDNMTSGGNDHEKNAPSTNQGENKGT